MDPAGGQRRALFQFLVGRALLPDEAVGFCLERRGGDLPEPNPALQAATVLHDVHKGRAGDRRGLVEPFLALDRRHKPGPGLPRPGVDGGSLIAGVDRHPHDRQHRAALVLIGAGQNVRQLLPGERVVGRSVDDDMIDQPRLESAAPCPDVDLDAVLLNVRASRQEKTAHRHLRRIVLLAILQALPIGGLARVHPRLAQLRVLEGAQQLVGTLRGLPLARHFLPRQPADGRIERRQVKADAARILGGGRGDPFASRQHLGLVIFGNRFLAGLAMIGRALGLALFPTQALPLQPLHVVAERAWHKEAPLVRPFEFALDPRQAARRRGRDKEHFAPMAEGDRPGLGQRDRVTFLVGRCRIAVDLVHEHIARRHRAQRGGALRADHDQNAAGEFL